MKFKVGDLVTLKSGGPKMTVSLVIEKHISGKRVEGYMCECTWFDKDELVQVIEFEEELLVAFSGSNNSGFTIS